MEASWSDTPVRPLSSSHRDHGGADAQLLIARDELRRLKRRPLLPWLLSGLLMTGLGATLAVGGDEHTKLRGELTSARTRGVELSQALARSRERADGLQAQLDQKSKQAAFKDLQLEQNDKLLGELRAQLDARDGDVSADANRITVNLVDEILFKSGEADLSPRGQKVLARVGGVLKTLDDKQILISGHTDDRPIRTERYPSNWELSAARAVRVVRYLSEVVGVDPHKLAAAGYSQYHPRARSKAKNRRIEVLLTPVVEVKKG